MNEKYKLSTGEKLLLNKVKSYFPDGLHKIGPNSDELFIVLNQAPLNEDDMKDCMNNSFDDWNVVGKGNGTNPFDGGVENIEK
jgi:hypothetical protein